MTCISPARKAVCLLFTSSRAHAEGAGVLLQLPDSDAKSVPLKGSYDEVLRTCLRSQAVEVQLTCKDCL